MQTHARLQQQTRRFLKTRINVLSATKPSRPCFKTCERRSVSEPATATRVHVDYDVSNAIIWRGIFVGSVPRLGCVACNPSAYEDSWWQVPLAGGRATQRMKHTCRVCTRLVCSTNNSDGCSALQPVPLKLWSRKLPGSIRRPDAKLECVACKEHDGRVPPLSKPGDEGKPSEGTCACTTGWVCTWCAVQIGHIQKNDMFGVLAKVRCPTPVSQLPDAHPSFQRRISASSCDFRPSGVVRRRLPR